MNSESAILGANILIVDDNLPNVLLLEAFLTAVGYTQLTSTQNSEDVCLLHQTHPYDLILLDLKMPVMDGFAVMETLKALKIHQNDTDLPVIVLTAEPAHRLRALKAGAKDFISKPFDLAEIRTRIYAMLEVQLLHEKPSRYSPLPEQNIGIENPSSIATGGAKLRTSGP